MGGGGGGLEPLHISKRSIIILHYTIPIAEKQIFFDSKLAALQCFIIAQYIQYVNQKGIKGADSGKIFLSMICSLVHVQAHLLRWAWLINVGVTGKNFRVLHARTLILAQPPPTFATLSPPLSWCV